MGITIYLQPEKQQRQNKEPQTCSLSLQQTYTKMCGTIVLQENWQEQLRHMFCTRSCLHSILTNVHQRFFFPFGADEAKEKLNPLDGSFLSEHTD